MGGGHPPCTRVRQLHPTPRSGNPALTLTPQLPPSSRDCAILGAPLSLKSPNHPVGRCGLFPAGTPQGQAGPLRVDSESKLLTSKSCLHPPSYDSRSPITSLGLTFLICEMGTKLLPPPHLLSLPPALPLPSLPPPPPLPPSPRPSTYPSPPSPPPPEFTPLSTPRVSLHSSPSGQLTRGLWVDVQGV